MKTESHSRERAESDVPTGPERLIDGEGERLVLGNILARGAEFWKVVGPQLTDDCFALDASQRVFSLMKSVTDAGGVPDLGGCYRALIDQNKTSGELGLPLLSELAHTNQVDLVNPEPWLNALRRRAAERRAWHVAERLRLGIESGDATEQVASVREELRKIETDLQPAAPKLGTLGDTIADIGIESLLATPRGLIASPWERLDGLTNGGPRPGELWIIGARPSVGKTTVVLQSGSCAAAAGHRVLFASLEMPQQDLIKRLLSAEGNIPHGLLVRGQMDQSWRVRVAQTLEKIGDYPLEITDKIRSLSALIAKIASTPSLALVVVDYLGLVEAGGRYENRNQEVSAISRRLKLAALDYGIPIIAAHQLNRGNETENRRPQLSDLRDSGSLEQDADVVLMLDAPATRKGGKEERKDAVDMVIAKQRNGVRGYAIRLSLEGQFCRMTQAESETDNRAKVA